MTALKRLTPWLKPQEFRGKWRSRGDPGPETGGHPSAGAGGPFPDCIAALPRSAAEASPSSSLAQVAASPVSDLYYFSENLSTSIVSGQRVPPYF